MHSERAQICFDLHVVVDSLEEGGREDGAEKSRVIGTTKKGAWHRDSRWRITAYNVQALDLAIQMRSLGKASCSGCCSATTMNMVSACGREDFETSKRTTGNYTQLASVVIASTKRLPNSGFVSPQISA